MDDHNQKQDSDQILVVFFFFLVSPTPSFQEAKFGESHLQAWCCHLTYNGALNNPKEKYMQIFFCQQLERFMSSLRMLFCELMGKKKPCYFFHKQLTFVNNKAPDHQVANLSINSPWQERQPDCMQAFMTAFLNVGFGL